MDPYYIDLTLSIYIQDFDIIMKDIEINLCEEDSRFYVDVNIFSTPELHFAGSEYPDQIKKFIEVWVVESPVLVKYLKEGC